MAVKKVESFNIHETPAINQNMFDVETYLNANLKKTKEAVNNNAEELMQVQKDITTLKEDNKTNKSSIDVLEKSNETRDGKISKNTEDIEAIQGSIKTATETINKKDNEQDEDIKANKETIKEIQAENERLRNDIKSIAVVNEVSGENIHIEDSSNARCEIEIGGNHQQDTREGYNQFKITSTQTQSAGVTITKIDESSVSYQGTTTGMFTHMLVEYDGKGLEITKQMYLKAFGNLTNAILSVKLIKNGKTESSYLRVSPDLILSAGDVLQQIYVQQQNTGILISGTLQVLLTDYENKDKPYEQYGASPSMNFPSEVKSVGSNVNIIDINSYKSISDGCTINKIKDNEYKIVVNNQYNWARLEYDLLNIKMDSTKEKYTLSFDAYVTNSKAQIAYYFLKDSTQIGSKKVLNSVQYAHQELMLGKSTNLVNKLVLWLNAGALTELPFDIYIKNLKIEKGSVATLDSSYNCGSAKIDIFNKNYLSKIPKKSITAQGVTSTFDGEKFICKGTAQANYFNLLTENVYKKIGKGIKTLSTNKLKKGRVFIHLDYVDGTSQNYYTSINTNRASFNLNKDVESYRLNVDSITAGDTIDDNIYVQLEDGNIATEIEKAENQEYLVDVQQEMLEGDTFVRQDGKWYEMHNWIKIIVDGTNVKVTDTKDTGYVIQALLGTKNCKPGIGYSNRFIYDKVLTWKTPNTLIFTTIGVYLHFDRSLLVDLTINNENINAMLKKQYDSGNEIYVLGQLLEPQLLECTEAQSKVLDEIYNKAHTYKNITNISAESSEVNPIINVKYLKDSETEHKKMQAQIDEIKELLSSTETSAMLLNNMQTDLESEV